MDTHSEHHSFGVLGKLFAHWVKRRAFLADLDGLSPEDRAAILHDMNLNESDVDALANGALDTDNLSYMLKRLGVNEDAMEKAQPELVADLRRNCAKCVDWKDCEHKIAKGTVAYPSPDYCPNRDTLASLSDDHLV